MVSFLYLFSHTSVDSSMFKHFFIYIVAFFCIVSMGLSQERLHGEWRGLLISSGQNAETADVIYLSLPEGDSKGFSRVEVLNTKEFAYKEFTFEIKNKTLSIEEKYIRLSSHSPSAPKCKLKYSLKYNDSTMFLEGDFTSSDCRNKMGKVVLYRTEHPISSEKEPTLTHYWKYHFARAYDKGYPSPEVLERERKNFEFQPIYFDHDESIIKEEFHGYLNKLAWMLDALPDLRLKVIGHTDAVGTDQYNMGLSERRAKAIKDYFLSRGIVQEKLEIDFKGKRMPVDTNKTQEGKQRNRRVDFKFV